KDRIAVVHQLQSTVNQISACDDGGPVVWFGRADACAFKDDSTRPDARVGDNGPLALAKQAAQKRVVGPALVFAHLGVNDQVPRARLQRAGKFQIGCSGGHRANTAGLLVAIKRVKIDRLCRPPSLLIVEDALASLRAKAMDLAPDQGRAGLGVSERVGYEAVDVEVMRANDLAPPGPGDHATVGQPHPGEVPQMLPRALDRGIAGQDQVTVGTVHYKSEIAGSHWNVPRGSESEHGVTATRILERLGGWLARRQRALGIHQKELARQLGE